MLPNLPGLCQVVNHHHQPTPPARPSCSHRPHSFSLPCGVLPPGLTPTFTTRGLGAQVQWTCWDDSLTTGNVSGMGSSSDTVSSQSVTSFMMACQMQWKPATAATPNSILIFRGLRVRMGMTSGGATAADVTYNKAASRMQYSGAFLQAAKYVGDAAAGGMVLLSEGTHSRLPLTELWDKAMVLNFGDYVLSDSLPPMTLYQMVGRRLMGRLGHLSVTRCKEVLSKGVQTAPIGMLGCTVVQAVGAKTLLSWNEGLARAALHIFHEAASRALAAACGFLVEKGDDTLQAVFPNAAEAIVWPLRLLEGLLISDWPPDLLDHELCEELLVGDTAVFRGLRIKAGVDAGMLLGKVTPATGRLSYRGKAAARAPQLVTLAASNQVLATKSAWVAANASGMTRMVLDMAGVAAEPLGAFKLKSISDRAEVLQCRLKAMREVVHHHRPGLMVIEDEQGLDTFGAQNL
ncbi:nucleotide cyclase [Haematococcus lacustris]